MVKLPLIIFPTRKNPVPSIIQSRELADGAGAPARNDVEIDPVVTPYPTWEAFLPPAPPARSFPADPLIEVEYMESAKLKLEDLNPHVFTFAILLVRM